MKITMNYDGIESLLNNRDMVSEYYDEIHRAISKAFYNLYLKKDGQEFSICHIEFDDNLTMDEEGEVPMITVAVCCHTICDGDFTFTFDFDATESVDYNAGYISAMIRMQLGDYE